MKQNPGKTATLYNVAEIAGLAYPKAFTLNNITSGFRATGVYPFNPDIFQEHEYLSSYVTDLPFVDGSKNEPSGQPASFNLNSTKPIPAIPVSANLPLTSSGGINLSSTSIAGANLNLTTLSGSTTTIISPSSIRQHPKTSPRKIEKRLTRKVKGKSKILTDTPEKKRD